MLQVIGDRHKFGSTARPGNLGRERMYLAKWAACGGYRGGKEKGYKQRSSQLSGV